VGASDSVRQTHKTDARGQEIEDRRQRQEEELECRLSGNQGTVICDDGRRMRDDGQAVDPAKIFAGRMQVIKVVCGASPTRYS
jgi:hypothetical protein